MAGTSTFQNKEALSCYATNDHPPVMMVAWFSWFIKNEFANLASNTSNRSKFENKNSDKYNILKYRINSSMIVGTHQSARYEAKQFDGRRMNKNEPPKYWRNPLKGEKCNKRPGRYRTSVVKKQRIWPRTSVADKSSATWLCKLYLPTAETIFRFTFAYNVYSFHIFIRFPSPRSFRFVLKVAEQWFPRALFP